MGLLSFTKKSRKQGPKSSTTKCNQQQLQSFTPSPHHIPQQDNESYPLHKSGSTTRYLGIDSTVLPKQSEISLMDDIMNELDSVKSIRNADIHQQNNAISNITAVTSHAANLNNNINTTITKPSTNVNNNTNSNQKRG